MFWDVTEKKWTRTGVGLVLVLGSVGTASAGGGLGALLKQVGKKLRSDVQAASVQALGGDPAQLHQGTAANPNQLGGCGDAFLEDLGRKGSPLRTIVELWDAVRRERIRRRMGGQLAPNAPPPRPPRPPAPVPPPAPPLPPVPSPPPPRPPAAPRRTPRPKPKPPRRRRDPRVVGHPILTAFPIGKYTHVSSRHGPRKRGRSTFHHGIDLAAVEGTPIYAAGDGWVGRAEHQSGYGYFVNIDHADGRGTIYAHMRAPALVRKDQEVRAGQLIGHVGSTGISSGNHLHFEIRRADAASHYDRRTEDPSQFYDF